MTTRLQESVAQFLDIHVPLCGASHSDVVEYAVTVPMRNAEVHAMLANGRTVRLENARQLVGWSGYAANPMLLLDCGCRRVIVNTGRTEDSPPMMFVSPTGEQVSSVGAVRDIHSIHSARPDAGKLPHALAFA